MRKKNGFVISTTLYSIFGIMLLTVFYILYALSNNRYVASTSINGIKDKLANPPEIIIDVPIFNDTSGANEPVLADGMIPVVYNEEKEVWVRADTEAGWYAYQDQIWANAVTTTNTNRATYLSEEHIGKEIPMDEINSMWVWIPRFKYNIASEYGTHANGTVGTLSLPGLINVEFETGTNSTGSVYSEYITSTYAKYYTHPAFRDGSTVYNETPYDLGGWDEELPGFWVGKFEGWKIKPDVSVSEVGSTGDTLSMREFKRGFDKCLSLAGGIRDDDDYAYDKITFTANSDNEYGLNTQNTNTNTHMMKNTEWVAVAYLSQSKYGKMGNDDYTGEDKEVYNNNCCYQAPNANYEYKFTYTGRSGGEPKTSRNCNYAGFYSYNDYKCESHETNCKSAVSKGKGTGASTTGTIYGIYDMNGGKKEMLSTLKCETGGGISCSIPINLEYHGSNRKYGEVYNYNSSEDDFDILLSPFFGFETRNWYTNQDSDNGIFKYQQNCMVRESLFQFDFMGKGTQTISSRVVLIEQ